MVSALASEGTVTPVAGATLLDKEIASTNFVTTEDDYIFDLRRRQLHPGGHPQHQRRVAGSVHRPPARHGSSRSNGPDERRDDEHHDRPDLDQSGGAYHGGGGLHRTLRERLMRGVLRQCRVDDPVPRRDRYRAHRGQASPTASRSAVSNSTGSLRLLLG